MSVVESSDKLLYSIPDAGRVIGRKSRSAVYQLIHEGKLRAVRAGGRTLIPRQSLEEYAAGLPEVDLTDNGTA